MHRIIIFIIVLMLGCAPVLHIASTESPPLQITYERILHPKWKPQVQFIDLGKFTVTFYTNSIACCGKTDGITASGAIAKDGVTIAADWSVLPKGTQVYVQNYGYRVVQDRGGAVKGKHIDIFVANIAESKGKIKCEVYLVKPAP